MVKIIDGNLFSTDAEVICHQVNCQGRMGSGVALQIKRNYPTVYDEYVAYCATTPQKDLLGQAQGVWVNGNRIIYNLFGQENYGYDGKAYTNIKALRNCFITMKDNLPKEYKIAMPYGIGCVRGGAEWGKVYKMIEEIFKDREVELWRLNLG